MVLNKTNRSLYSQKNISGSEIFSDMFADTVEDTVKDSRAVIDLCHNNTAFYQGIHILRFILRIHIAYKLFIFFAGLKYLHQRTEHFILCGPGSCF